MPSDNQSLIPAEIADQAIWRNLNIASRLHWMLVFFQSGRFEDAMELANNLVKGMAETDAALRTLRDAATKDLRLLDGNLPYTYTTDHKCAVCDNPLRYPLVWNRTLKESGKYICSVGECSGSGGATRLTFSNEADDAEPDCDTAG
jgi:hypothetical protein|tara:strand:- start:84 stop:521 length:438 start_codon:yes stop_codon:yes gene_type:complete